MASFNQIVPWIALGILFAVVIFFSAFYIIRLLKASSDTIPANNDGQRTNDEKTKLKNEIVHDIVADITPVLEKRLEKAF